MLPVVPEAKKLLETVVVANAVVPVAVRAEKVAVPPKAGDTEKTERPVPVSLVRAEIKLAEVRPPVSREATPPE